MKRFLLCTLSALWLAACAAPTVREHLLTAEVYPPTTRVETLLAWPTDRKYVEIAELEAVDSTAASKEEVRQAFLEKAKALGADAIVWGAKRSGGPVFQQIGELVAGVPEPISHAVAIKYLP